MARYNRTNPEQCGNCFNGRINDGEGTKQLWCLNDEKNIKEVRENGHCPHYKEKVIY